MQPEPMPEPVHLGERCVPLGLQIGHLRRELERCVSVLGSETRRDRWELVSSLLQFAPHATIIGAGLLGCRWFLPGRYWTINHGEPSGRVRRVPGVRPE